MTYISYGLIRLNERGGKAYRLGLIQSVRLDKQSSCSSDGQKIASLAGSVQLHLNTHESAGCKEMWRVELCDIEREVRGRLWK